MADEPVLCLERAVDARSAAVGRGGIGRFCHRDRGFMLIAAVKGLTAGTVLLSQANARTERQRKLTEANYQRSEQNFRKAREAVDEYFTKVSESKLLNVPGLQPLRKELLESARKYYEDFLGERGDDKSVRADAAMAWLRIGSLNTEVGSAQEAALAFRKAQG